MLKTPCILLAMVLSVGTYAQNSGTFKVAKPGKPTAMVDTFKIMFGDPEYFKRVQTIYPTAATANMSGFIMKKRLPSGYFIVTYPQTGTLRSEGAVVKGKKQGLWSLCSPAKGSSTQYYEYNKGKRIRQVDPDNE